MLVFKTLFIVIVALALFFGALTAILWVEETIESEKRQRARTTHIDELKECLDKFETIEQRYRAGANAKQCKQSALQTIEEMDRVYNELISEIIKEF